MLVRNKKILVAATEFVTVFFFAWYFYHVIQHPFENSLIGVFNLLMHEAGHFFFFFGGDIISILGGSFMQVVIPLIFAFAFYRQYQWLGVSFSLMWAGQNFVEVATYAGDAIVMQLPLLGGDAVLHDWNYILTYSGMLDKTEFIAHAFNTIGMTLFVFGTLFGTYMLGKELYGVLQETRRLKKLEE